MPIQLQSRSAKTVLQQSYQYHGKREVKDPWSEVEYMVVHQVADDVPLYEVCDDGGNIKIIHHNWLFLVATPQGEATPLGASESLSEEGAAQSTRAELTPLEWEMKHQRVTWMRQQPYALPAAFCWGG